MDNLELLQDLFIDESLTPENASLRGYEWIGDVIYDREAPFEAMEHIIHMVEKENYALGKSAGRMGRGIYQGLYAPIEEE